jgi:hypothetical protein
VVGSSGVVKDNHNDAGMQGIQIPKNGYIYIYCSNESPVDVFFDNVQVVHTRGQYLKKCSEAKFAHNQYNKNDMGKRITIRSG